MTPQNKKLRAVFIAAVCFVLLLSIYSYIKIKSLIEAGRLLNRTTEVTLHLEKVIGSLKDAETGHRGYLLTHDKIFLEAFNEGLQNYPGDIEKVRQLTMDNPLQQQNLMFIQTLAQHRKDYMFKMLEVDKLRHPTVEELLAGKMIMDSLRTQVNKMIAVENNLMDKRLETYGNQIMLAPALLLLLSLIAITILVSAYWQLNKSLLNAQQLKAEIFKKNVAAEKNKELQNLFLQAPVAICILRGKNFVIELANERQLELWGKTKEQVISLPVFDAMPQGKGQGFEELLTEVFKTGNPCLLNELPINLTRQGNIETIYTNFVYQALYDAEHKIDAVMSIAVDVTDQVIARNEIEAKENEYRQLANIVPSMVWQTDEKGVQTFASARWKEFTGLDPEDLRTFEKIVHPDDMAGIIKAWTHSLSTGELYKHEVRIKSKNGHYHWFQVDGEPVFNTERKIEKWIGAFTDINERKISEENAKENEKRFKLALAGTNQIVFSQDTLLKHTWIYNAHPDFKPEQILGKTDKELHSAASAEKLTNIKQAILTTGKPFNGEMEIEIAGKQFIYHMTIEATKDNNEKITGIIGVALDITEQKNIEKTLKESEKQLRKTTEHFEIATTAAEVGTWSLDISSETLVWSALHKKMWGYDEAAANLTYEDWHKVILPGDKEKAFAEVEKALKTKTLYEASYRIKRADDGEIRWMRSFGQYFYNEAGKPSTLTGVTIDTTEKTETEVALKESEKRFRTLADFMPQKIWMTDAKGDVIYHNRQYFDFTGLSLNEFKERGWQDYIHPDDLAETSERWNHSLSTGDDYEMELRLRNKQGIYLWHLNRAMPFRDGKGNIIMWIGSDTEIQKTKDEQKKKDDFIKIVSHELKTPVTSIKGYVQLITMMMEVQKEKYPAQFITSLSRIDSQVIRLTKLITEMLDLSRIETGKLELQMETFSINELTAEVVQDIRQTHPGHDLNLVFDYKANIKGDRDRIGQVLINFINNAIKYSPGKDKVEVSVKKVSKGMVAVSVKDYGIGISKEEHEKIFERFYRAEGDNENTFAGFGIGLFIANDIVKKHYGSITVKSELNKGSEFSFHLPILQ